MAQEHVIAPALFDAVHDFIDKVRAKPGDLPKGLTGSHPLVVFWENALVQFGNYLGKKIEGANPRSWDQLKRARQEQPNDEVGLATQRVILLFVDLCRRIPEAAYNADRADVGWLHRELTPKLLEALVQWSEAIGDRTLGSAIKSASDDYASFWDSLK